VDWLVLVFVGALGVLLAVAVGQSINRGRQLDEILEVTAGMAESEDPVVRVRRLRERAEAAEWEAIQQRLDASSMADQIGVGIVHVDDDGRVDVANTAAHAFLDRAPGTMIGRTTIEAFVDRRLDAMAGEARESGASGGEVTVREADGRTLVVRARRSPIRGLWIVLEDVTELRHLQQIRAEFIDNLSHELRTPLTTVSLLAETLHRDADAAGDAVPPTVRERIAKIEVETGHLVQMVNELLDLSRIESGAAVVHLDEVDLARLAVASTERLRLFAERQGVAFRVEAPEDLPRVRGDEGRLGQVLVNLLHNAVKFSPRGGDVVVRLRVDGDDVLTEVEDHGIGIPSASLDRVFERFYKVDRARVRGGGTGLGLAIARHVVEQHGGRLWVDSEEGRGSTFSFAVRRADA
jgi:two-component system phosphate regulon sensor histidine kinase PhoR